MIRIMGMRVKPESLFIPFMAFVAALFLPLTTYIASTDQDFRSQAAVSHFTFMVEPPSGTNVYFDPGNATLAPDTPVKIMGNFPTNEIVFVKAVIQYDPASVEMTGEINTNAAFSTIVEKTTMADANAGGQATIIIASSPADIPQTGTFGIADFTISPVAGATGQTSMDFLDNEMQIVDKLTQEIPISPGNLIINFDGSSVTPDPSLDSTPTDFPIGEPTIDPNITQDPQISVEPQPTDQINPPVAGGDDDDDDNDDDGVKNDDDDDDDNDGVDDDDDDDNDNDGVDDDDDDDDDNDGEKDKWGDTNTDGKVNLVDAWVWVLNLFR